MTTKVNLLLPIFEINLPCNNPQIITKILQDRYTDFVPSEIYWLQQKNGSQQCVIRIDKIKHNLDSIIQLAQSNAVLQETVKRLQQDIFNIVEIFSVQRQKIALKVQKLEEQLKQRHENGSVSLKVDAGSYQYQQQKEYADKRLLLAVSELTRQNIKLKDALSYYQVQLQLIQQQSKASVLKTQPKK